MSAQACRAHSPLCEEALGERLAFVRLSHEASPGAYWSPCEISCLISSPCSLHQNQDPLLLLVTFKYLQHSVTSRPVRCTCVVGVAL